MNNIANAIALVGCIAVGAYLLVNGIEAGIFLFVLAFFIVMDF